MTSMTYANRLGDVAPAECDPAMAGLEHPAAAVGRPVRVLVSAAGPAGASGGTLDAR